MAEFIFAPFTQEQVDNLNRFQHLGWVHPFTCRDGHRTDEWHKDGEGLLVATKAGWICPYCDYTQNWAHSFMAEKHEPPISRIWGALDPNRDNS